MHQQVDADHGSTRYRRTFTVPGEGFLQSVLAHSVDRFLESGNPLVGRPLDRLRIGAPTSAAATLHAPDALDEVDTSDGSVPAFLSGEVRGAADAPIAVVVNGVIAGVSDQFHWVGHDHVFQVMIPEELIRQRNRVALYTVDRSNTLHAITLRR
jgi:hypothetical protein